MGKVIRLLAALVIILGLALSVFAFLPSFAHYTGGNPPFYNTPVTVAAGIIMLLCGLFVYVFGEMISLLKEIRDAIKKVELGLTNINWGIKNIAEGQSVADKSPGNRQSASAPSSTGNPAEGWQSQDGTV